MIRLSFFLAALLFSLNAFAVTPANYVIFVDAGSSGSRLHIFQYQKSTTVPVINDVFSEGTKPGLSAFAENPATAGESLKKLFDDATQFLQKQKINPQAVQINVLATAGMRLLSQEKQKAIYDNVTKYMKTNYSFSIGEVKTITGMMEGLYGWLDVNYLAGNFQQHKPTVGSIDMGGASTQIAFATQDNSKKEDEVFLRINSQNYTVFSKSFLGLGQDQARDTMQMNANAAACFPSHYTFNKSTNGDFNLAACGAVYMDVIQKQKETRQVISAQNQPFVAYSGIYYAYNFFATDQTPDQSTVENRIQSVCSESWEQLKQDYPQVAEKYLSTYCANGVYIDQLLYGAYKLQGKQLTVAAQIQQKDIDWTLGAALYSLIS